MGLEPSRARPLLVAVPRSSCRCNVRDVEIVSGVHAIDFRGVVWAYLHREADRLTLIDTGIAGEADKILNAIERIGAKPQNLRQVIVTHHHKDHTGCLADLQQRINVRVLAHRLDAPVIRGEQRANAPPLSEPERLLYETVSKDVPEAPSARVDQELNEGDEIDLGSQALVVHVPGHTPGSIALYVPAQRILFAGDAVASMTGQPIVGVFNVDPEEAKASFRKLAGLDFEVACFGHGPPLDRQASLAFRRLAETLR